MKLDPWQIEFLEEKGDKILYCGRQIGKSVICSIDCCEWAVNNENATVLMIAPTERQAFALFSKTLDYILSNYPKMLKKGRDRPTQTKMQLKNNTKIWCLPTGLNGVGIRFLKVDRLYCEEASRIPAAVMDAVTPMLLTSGGAQIYLTTPAGKGTYASDVWNNKNGAFTSFKRFSKSSEEVMRNREICETWTEIQREKALQHIERERARMSNAMFRQEYCGEEIESLMQFFPTALIQSCMTIPEVSQLTIPPGCPLYLGADIAAQGEDETVLFSVCNRDGKLKQIGMEILKKNYLTDTVIMIKELDSRHKYQSIFVDDGGIGFGVFDMLLHDPQTRSRVIAINNSTRILDNDETKKKRLMKEQLYVNLKSMMEAGKVALVKDMRILQSLQSVQMEPKDGDLCLSGDYTHIAEALIRAAWGFAGKKHLNLWIASKSHGFDI